MEVRHPNQKAPARRGGFPYCLLCLLALALLSGCGRQSEAADPLLKARADALCKEAFVNRYRDPAHAVAVADSALAFLADSLPDYWDGQFRAWNTRVCGLYLLSVDDSARSHFSPLLHDEALTPGAKNFDVEQALALLFEARWAQRGCETARSYMLLYDIERSGVLDRAKDNYLYSYVRSEYYITQLLLNYHYRNGSLIDGAQLLDEIERTRPSLRVDYAQDMALNYAMAHAYHMLCHDAPPQLHATYLARSFGLLQENLDLLAMKDGYCQYEMANTLQMIAFLASDPLFDSATWQAVAPQTDTVMMALDQWFDFHLDPDEDPALDLFMVSTDLFFRLPDPYQRLGAAVATADWALELGDTALAHTCYGLALADTAAAPYGFAPKFERMLYDGLIRSLYPGTVDDYGLWFDRLGELNALIAANQSADFQMQVELEQTRLENRRIGLVIIVISLLLVALAVALVLLRRRTRALSHEKRLLEEAKKADVERIANVETCLSVLRHDITPFISYLQNERLPEPLRREVVEQLGRTFDNIKNWTTLSAPTGMRFHVEQPSLSAVFADVQGQVVNLRPEAVQLRFQPTDLRLRADRQLVTILLRNLVTNALQHTETGSVEVAARRMVEDDRFVQLTVSDTGVGMDAEALDELFRSDKRPSPSGHGFGLILCRYIIKLHDDHTLRGCRIWAESAPGRGTSIHLLLAAAP